MTRTPLRKQSKSPVKESDIQRAICEWLDWKKRDFWRNNTSPVVQRDSYGFRMRAMPKYAKKGVPDIFVMLPKRMVFLEVKRPNGILSPDQKMFRAMCERNEHGYYVVRSVEETEEALKSELKKLKAEE